MQQVGEIQVVKSCTNAKGKFGKILGISKVMFSLKDLMNLIINPKLLEFVALVWGIKYYIGQK
jgi:hypothetical protein